MNFESLGLDPRILEALQTKGYEKPSPIQEKAIPAILRGDDVMAAAQTGTGKTAGFTLPILDLLSKGTRAASNQVRALILTPTRELAAQVAESVDNYGAHLPLRSSVVFGGVKINPQMMRLRRGSDILVATPGRLIDLYQQNAVKFNQLEILVLDEADRMLDMGFIHDIRKIMQFLPRQRQNLLFSATFSKDIRELAKKLVNNPVEISVSPPNTTAHRVTHKLYVVDKRKKGNVLVRLVLEGGWSQVLAFTRTKHGANQLAKHLNNHDIKATAIHGNKSQSARTSALADFKAGKIRVLVATDIAARGLDIDQLPHVVNVDLPNVPEDYVHRIGRTGRAGASGDAVSLVSHDEHKQLVDIERLIKQVIPRRYHEDFYPINELPASRSLTGQDKNRNPNRPKRPARGAPGRKPKRSAQSETAPGRDKPSAWKNKNAKSSDPGSTSKQGSGAAGKKAQHENKPQAKKAAHATKSESASKSTKAAQKRKHVPRKRPASNSPRKERS